MRMLVGMVLFSLAACVDDDSDTVTQALTQLPLFKAQFEGTTALGTPQVQLNDSWQYFSGADTSFTWPMTVWGANPSSTGMHLIHYDLHGGSVDLAQRNRIVSMTGHDGSTTRALEMTILDPNDSKGCCAQDVFQLSGLSAPPRELYQRFWLKLPAEAKTQCETSGGEWWRYLWSYKTHDDHRIAVELYPHGQNGCGSWHVTADNNTGSGKYGPTSYWSRQNQTAPVSFGRWMLVEVYVNRTRDANARFFLGIDGQTVFDVRDGTTNAFFGVEGQDINLVIMSNVYGKTSYPATQWVDDVELYGAPPCGSANLPCGGAPAANLLAKRVPTGRTTLFDAAYATDGDRDTTRSAGAGSGPQWIRFDLGQSRTIDRVKLWHYYADGRTYRDVIVQLSNSADFSSGVVTVFNNDTDNTSGQGAGTSAAYAETAGGKLISFSAVNARYLRLWSNGSTVNAWNHYVEVEAYGPTSTSSSLYPLGVTTSGSGRVTSSPSGIDCGTVCNGSFAIGSAITLTAKAAAGWSFAGWSGACAGAGPACSVTMSAAREVTATFSKN